MKMRKRANEELRWAMRSNFIAQWEVAEALNISEVTLCRWLRTELPEEKRNAILDAINKLKEAE